jgi:large subunit ribosomal protein L1
MSKRTKANLTLVDKTKRYSLTEAASIVKKAAPAKFDEAVEVHVRLGVDVKKSDQNVRGVVSLPHGTGKSRRVVVVAKGDKIKEAEAAGANLAGDAEVVEKISKGWMDFDVLVATPDAMKDLTKLAKVLGPRGLMPNPKSGTVTFDIARTVKELKAGRVEFKMDQYGVVHAAVGRVSFSEANIETNVKAFLDAVNAAKPATAKGVYVKGVTLCSTMGPGIALILE